jgi:hypothetical protein
MNSFKNVQYENCVFGETREEYLCDNEYLLQWCKITNEKFITNSFRKNILKLLPCDPVIM